jgi:hypothetical protein
MNKPLRFFILVLLFHCLTITSIVYGQKIAFQGEATFNQVSNIAIDADFCTVKIKGSDSTHVTYSGILKSDVNPEEYTIATQLSEGELVIAVQRPESWTSHWGEIILMVPNGSAMDVHTKSGKVEIEGLTDCTVNIESNSGHVQVASATGTIIGNSPAGDFIVDDYNGLLEVNSKTGKVILRDIKGDVLAESNKGEFIINHLSGTLKTVGGSGSQDIENVEGDIALKSSDGDIELSQVKGNIVTRSFAGNQKLFQTEGIFTIQSSTGTITGNSVVFTASSSFTSTEGTIKVNTNTKKDLAFVLKSENSFLRAMGKSKKKSLKIGKGNILITGTSTTGSQAYY